MSTAHANSCRDMLNRIMMMTRMGIDLPLDSIREQIASGIDIMIHLGRMKDKSRRLLEVTEVIGCKDGEILLNPLFQWDNSLGLMKKGELIHREKLHRRRDK